MRELSRVATAETEAEWIEAARGQTVRQVEELVSGHKTGDRPGDRKNPDRERRVLRFEVSAETFAEFREALDRLERDAGERLTDDDALRQMARQILGGPTDDMCIEATPLAWLDPGPVRNQVMFKKGTWRVPGHSPTRARAAVRGGGAPR